ncbi:MAG: DinB family protein [Williamsia sp.]|nr:DinB family protein [Williamsia sp.]
MNIIPLLVKEFEQEAATTRKMLALVPTDKFDWKPHPKSMSIKQLTVHLAEIPSWPAMMFATDGLDFASSPYQPKQAENADGLLKLLEESIQASLDAFGKAKEEDLLPIWTLRNGEHILAEMTKYEAIRHSFSQTTHHRAQFGVFLRLLNIPIPGSYGPSADEMGM